MQKFSWKLWLIIILSLGTFIFFFSQPVMTQRPEYHLFVDSRDNLGIPNIQDVVSNIFFVVVGFLGAREALKQTKLKKSWFAFFASVFLVGPGSAYYHWSPDNFTLIWDRLPMSLAFMALYITLLSEHISLSIEKYLVPALIIGVSSVVIWAVTSDLRFYFWIQFSSFLAIPFILTLYKSHFTHKHWYGFTLIFYALAKITEIKDHEIFLGTNEMISGHTLKHILAAIGLLGLWWMLRIRKEAQLQVPVGR